MIIGADGIGSDYPACGCMAAEYLIRRGHTRLAYMNPIVNHGGFQEIGWAFRATAQRMNTQTIELCTGFESDDLGIWDAIKCRESVARAVAQIAAMPIDQRPTGLGHSGRRSYTIGLSGVKRAGDRHRAGILKSYPVAIWKYFCVRWIRARRPWIRMLKRWRVVQFRFCSTGLKILTHLRAPGC